MKEFTQNKQHMNKRQTRNQTDLASTSKLHQRGDKVVVNGAKQSLLSIVKKHICQCDKHTGDKLMLNFLSQNKLTASYDVIVWMLVFLRINFEHDLYMTIVKQYLMKMNKKVNESQSHQSQKYKSSKKKTLQKFIESGEFFINEEISQKTIEQSVSALYSKGKSRDNSLNKIKAYLIKIKYKNELTFQQNSCSFRLYPIEGVQQSKSPLIQKQQLKLLKVTSENSEVKISQIDPQQYFNEDTELEMLEDYQSMSQWVSPNKQQYDLFEELINNEKSDQSLRSSY